MLDAMRVLGRGNGAVAQIVGTIAVPVSEAVLKDVQLSDLRERLKSSYAVEARPHVPRAIAAP